MSSVAYMDTEKSAAVPEILAVASAREAADRARALDALSDKRSPGQRMVFALVIAAVGASPFVMRRLGVSDPDSFIIGYVGLFAAIFALEVYHLRRRLKAITYLLLQHERKGNE